MDDLQEGAKVIFPENNNDGPKISLARISSCSYWPIFQNKKVAMVKPMPPKERPKRDLKACHVPCLMSLAVLSPIAIKSGCKMNTNPCHLARQDLKRLLPLGEGVYQEEYEIEEIVDHQDIQGEFMYFIKWKDWGHEFNTWEPRKNLEHSHKILDNYDKRIHEIKRLKRKHGANYLAFAEKQKLIISTIQIASQHRDAGTLLKLIGRSVTEFSDTKGEYKAITEDLLSLANGQDRAKSKKCSELLIMKILSSDNGLDNDIFAFAQKRLSVLSSLKNWENSINNLPGVKTPVTVENHVDLEGPPKNFTYITDYKATNGIVINEDPPIGCECEDGQCYDNRKQCCAAVSGSHFAYNRNGTLMIPRGTPLYECNKRCSCGEECPNRVVQKGRSTRLSIFRTHNERGWGIKTLERIKKGSFVMEYVGEVITSEVAEQRGRIYDEEGRTYLFDLDFDGHSEYTVDAAHYGNVAHFMNHSCEPNLEVYVVWINNLDKNLPRIAFFARQDIRKGEELTFDYKMSASATPGEPVSPSCKNYVSPHLGSPGVTTIRPEGVTAIRQEGTDSPLFINPIKRIKITNDSVTSHFDPDVESVDNIYSSPVIEKRRIPCKCGMQKCRKYLF